MGSAYRSSRRADEQPAVEDAAPSTSLVRREGPAHSRIREAETVPKLSLVPAPCSCNGSGHFHLFSKCSSLLKNLYCEVLYNFCEKLMTDSRAFISFDFDHNEVERILFVGQSKNSRTPFNIEDWSSKATLPQSRWEQLIEDKIKRCHLLIVLVGDSVARASGVAKEIQMAKRNALPYCGVYVGRANTSTPLPPGLARNRTISWDWDKIAAAIKQMLKEGKNKH
jgi:hypothetical protein